MSQIHTHTITLGDTLKPLNAVIHDDNGNPDDLSAYDSVKFAIEDDSGTEILAETAMGVTIHPTQTFTAAAATDLLTCNQHGVKPGDQIVVATGTTLPTGLAAATRYFAVQVNPNTFALATVPDGPAIDITDAGTGTHTFFVVGSVQMDFASTEVDAKAEYRGWFVLIDSSEKLHVPNGERFIRVSVKTRGN
jgi:hypothetical protein